MSNVYVFNESNQTWWEKSAIVGKPKGLKGACFCWFDRELFSLQSSPWTEILIGQQEYSVINQSETSTLGCVIQLPLNREQVEDLKHETLWTPIEEPIDLFEYHWEQLKDLIQSELHVEDEKIQGHFNRLVHRGGSRPNLEWQQKELKHEIPLHPNCLSWDRERKRFFMTKSFWLSLIE
jgi:hypothetical protein